MRSAMASAQVKLDDLLEHAEAFIKALRAGKEFIADTKPFQARPAQPHVHAQVSHEAHHRRLAHWPGSARL